ncbi:a1fae60d-66bf-4313-bb7a-55df6bfb6296 [Thermothielavioides terrestris]|uniref:A1fae60d-66bf-4313-bb7a-55df6bfb6296 n=1 Tax=Thermothielavioides terrestris TaxID=2587410 RepID=A0A446BX99_9PEZI|nr:a1fae60d-66bf-4313-bb7a-55df6bfb6296 [Thermothielavioides terrestris]
MKLVVVLALLLGLAVALESTGLEAPNCPNEYRTSLGKPSQHRAKAALKQVPADLIDPDVQRRRESFKAMQRLRSQAQASDFYECTNPSQVPSIADCDVVVEQVLSTSDELVVTANSCLTFSYNTCQAFFCSLCETLITTTDFIGNELDTTEALCLQNGQAGTIVGEDAPQWDAGFTYEGQPLPTYDVC